MKKLFLLRHAEASMNAPSDRERPLTDFGKSQASALGEDMKRKNFVPELIYCSPARRTSETYEGLNFENIAAEQPERLYNAPACDLLNFIQNTNSNIASVMVIAHNPGIYQLAHVLAAEDVSDAYNKVLMGYPPASLSVLECDIDDWASIQPGQNTLIDLIN